MSISPRKTDKDNNDMGIIMQEEELDDLKKNLTNFQNIIKNISDGILVVDQSGVIVFTNQAGAALFNCSRDELLGELFGLPILPAQTGELDIIRKSRKPGIGRIIVTPTQWDEQPAFLVKIHDITERKEMEQALEDSEVKYHTLFEKAADSIILVDAKTQAIEDFNTKTYQNLGYQEEEFKKLKLSDFEVNDSTQAIKKKIDQVIDKGEITYKTQHRTKNGDIRTIRVNSSAITIQGKNYIQSILADITDRERMENELKRSNAELEQFAYAASHDLKEPLRVISSYIELIRENMGQKLDHKSLDFMNRTVEAANRMQSMIKDLLAYSRINLQGEPFAVMSGEDIIQEALKNLRTTINEKKAKITYPKLPDIKADRFQMVRVFQNLIGNSVKYCEEKSPLIHISVQDKQTNWQFCIADNGIGISKQFHATVFELFQRLHSRSKYTGTGMGLAITKKIINRHKGQIWIESSQGKGARFYFTLPKE